MADLGPHLDIIHTPPDVTVAITAVAQACRGWKPSLLVSPLQQQPIMLPLSAHICNYVADPLRYDLALAEAVLVATLVGVVTIGAMIWMTGLHRLPGALVRQFVLAWQHRRA